MQSLNDSLIHFSVAAGIPDFRSPGTGLYYNLQQYDLPYPSAIFELPFLMKNPKPFFTLAKALYPGNFVPTPCHYFVSFLNQKGILLRVTNCSFYYYYFLFPVLTLLFIFIS